MYPTKQDNFTDNLNFIAGGKALDKQIENRQCFILKRFLIQKEPNSKNIKKVFVFHGKLYYYIIYFILIDREID